MKRLLGLLLCVSLLVTVLPVTARAQELPFALYDAQEGGNLIEPAEDGSYQLSYPQGEGTTVYFRTLGDATFDEDCQTVDAGPFIGSLLNQHTYVFSVDGGCDRGSQKIDLMVSGTAYRVQISCTSIPVEEPENPGASGSSVRPAPFWDLQGEQPINGINSPTPVVAYRPGEETVFYVIGIGDFDAIHYFTDQSQTVEGVPADIAVEKVFIDDAQTKFAYKLTIPASMGGDFSCRYALNGSGGDLEFDDLTCQAGSQHLLLRAYNTETKTFGPFISEVPEIEGAGNYGVFRDGLQLLDYSAEILSAVVPAPAEIAVDSNGILTVSVSDYDAGFWISIAADRPLGEFAFQNAVDMTQVVPVTIDGKSYTLVWGMPHMGSIFTGPSSIGWGGEYYDTLTGPYQMALAMFEDYGGWNQSLALDQLPAISHVEAKVLADGHEIFDSMSTRGWENGLWTVDYKLLAKPAALILAVEVDIQTDAGMQTIQLQTLVKMELGSYTVVDCQELELDTVAKLNAYIKNQMPISKDSTTIVQLIPGHTYEGTIIADREGKWLLRGTRSDKNPTIIKGGIQVHVDVPHVTDLLFLAPEGENTSAFIPEGGNTAFRNCAFFGYDTALNGTEFGRADASDCLFVKNGTAISINGGTLGFGNVMSGNTFLSNDTAVRIVSLPTGMVPYDVRFTNSDFINNGNDILVPQEGIYYAHGNYFGHDEGQGAKWKTAVVSENVHTGIGYKHPLTPAKNQDETWWLWHLSKNNNILKPYSLEVLAETTEETALDAFLQSEEAPRMEQVEENPLVATGTTMLRSADASTLQISEEGLDQPMEISIADQNDNLTGTWQFGASLPSETDSISLQGMMLDLPEEFNLGMDVWTENGAVMVYVNDSVALRNVRPLIRVSCDAGAQAVVTMAGEPVASFADAASVTFQAICGGSYEIRPGTAVSLSAVQSKTQSGLSLSVRVDNWSAASCVGTPFCAVYDTHGQLLVVGQAEQALTVQSGSRAVVSVPLTMSREQLAAASYYKLFLLGEQHVPVSCATVQEVFVK